MHDLETLQNYRKKISECILDLERGLLAEDKKLQRFRFELGKGEFKDSQLTLQIERCEFNVEQIHFVLGQERKKLKNTNEQIKRCHDLIMKHGTRACLVQAVPHKWEILEQFPSGNWKRRRCRDCNTEERLGP